MAAILNDVRKQPILPVVKCYEFALMIIRLQIVVF